MQVHLVVLEALRPPSCGACGSTSRLVGLEPHPTNRRIDVCTYQCNTCAEVQTRETMRVLPTR
jgi:hypothetical protein